LRTAKGKKRDRQEKRPGNECSEGAVLFLENCKTPIVRRDCDMSIFMMFGKYSPEGFRKISSERTRKAIEIIKKNGGKVISMYAVLGEHDLVFTLDFPDAEKAMLTSMTLNKLTGISFVTSPVVDVEQFDKLVSEIKDM
jgi:uncharacterized protein with GYD domain